MWNKRTWPSHVFTSFARSSINTFVSEALDLEKNKTQNTHWGEGIPGMTCRQQTHSALGEIKKGENVFLMQRGNKQSTVSLFHTLPPSLGIAEPCKDAQLSSASSSCGTAHSAHGQCHLPGCDMAGDTAQPSPQNSTKPLQDPEECSCSFLQPSRRWSRKFFRDMPGTSPLTACLRDKWAWLEGIPAAFGSHSL